MDNFKKIAKQAIYESLNKNGYLYKKEKNEKKNIIEEKQVVVVEKKQSVLSEAQVITPKSFPLNTERLSNATKRAHERLYNNYVDKFNKASSALNAASQQEANSNSSQYRSLSIDRTYNLNAIKLHELYFYNISDLSSEIGVNSIPYMRLVRDFGSFEKWQFDFMAACRSSREGWAVLLYEPYSNNYMNVIVDLHTNNIPMNTIPVLVMDLWAHAYYNDYQDNKNDYIVAMMREINWDIVEARMTLAEKSEINGLYYIQPLYNTTPQNMVNNALSTQPPIENITNNNQITQTNNTGNYNEES